MFMDWRDNEGYMFSCWLCQDFDRFKKLYVGRDVEADTKYIIAAIRNVHPEYARLAKDGMDLTWGYDNCWNSKYRVYHIINSLFVNLVNGGMMEKYIHNKQYDFQGLIKEIRIFEYMVVCPNLPHEYIEYMAIKDADKIMSMYLED